MADCCDPEGYRSVFNGRFARRTAKRYRKRGLNPTAERMVQFVTDHGVEGATVLEIGGGVGEIQLELLRRGAARVTCLEISDSYEQEAALLMERSGMAGRYSRRILDIAQAPEQVEPADVVIMHRVVCCYPDYRRLLSAAGSHADRMLVFSHPAQNVITRGVIGSENLLRGLGRNSFRAYVHPPRALVEAAEGTGLRAAYRHHAWDWEVVGLLR